MNALAEIRKRVVHNGKLRYGAASRLAAILQCRQDKAVKIILGSPRGRYDAATAEQERALEKALADGVPFFAERVKKCTREGCNATAKCKGECARHYFQTWRKALSVV